MPAYLAVPAGGRVWPSVVVIHDALGMSADVRNQADWLASEGYLALARDLYHWGRRITCMIAFIREIREMDDHPPMEVRVSRGDAVVAALGIVVDRRGVLTRRFSARLFEGVRVLVDAMGRVDTVDDP
jgi:carboxymethylenebutenolidase